MMRVLSLGALVAFLLVAASPAHARLVYHRTGTKQIVAARDDGSQARVIARGIDASISPNGRHALVATTRRTSGGGVYDLRIVSTRGGRSRLLMRNAAFGYRNLGGRPVWSPDSRYVVTGADGGAVFLINAKTRRRRDMRAAFYASASFSPGGSRVALALGNMTSDPSEVFLFGLRGRPGRKLSYQGDLLTWGRGGLAYYSEWGLELRRRARGGRDRLMKHPSERRTVKPIDWSANGRRLLAEVEYLGEPQRAVLLNPSKGTKRTLPNRFTEVNELSRNGRRVLGVVDGNVVSVAPNGKARVLAKGADSPSWNR